MNNQFGLIGYPLGHSMSAFIHKRLFAISNKNCEYILTEFPPELLSENIPMLKTLGGFNITMPYKRDIIPYLHAMDEKAMLYGAVNTVLCGEKIIGYNTDVIGFQKSTDILGGIKNKKICIIGAGATAKMAASEGVLAGSDVTIAVRDGSLSKADKLCFDVARLKMKSEVHATTINQISGSFDMLINATPVGMFPNIDNCPIDENLLSKFSSVFDLIYNPIETVLIRSARLRGLNVCSGMTMLVWQAAAAHEIWYGAKFTDEQISLIIKEASEHLRQL